MTWRRFVPGATVVEVALAVVACGAAALVYRGFFAPFGHLPALGTACFVGTVTAILGHRRTWSTALVAVTGPVLVLVAGVFGGRFSEVLTGVRGSWNRLLTVAAPADPWPELLVVPALVMWAAAFCSVLLVLRARTVLAPLAPLLAGFLAAVFTVGNQAGGHALATVVFLVAALGLIAIRAHRSTGGSTVRIEQRSSRPVVALVVVGLVVAGSALFGVLGGRALPLASGEHRFDPRDLLAPPVTGTDTLTPLSRLKSQLKETPPRTLFIVRPSPDSEAIARANRLRTAVLDEFDGTTWTSSATYRVAGSHLTADPSLTDSTQVTVHIELKDLDGPYVPVVGWPSRLVADGGSQGRFGFDPGSGVAVRTSREPEELSYEVTGQIPFVGSVLSGTATTPGPVRELPAGMPESLRALSARCTADTSYSRLTELEQHLRNTPSRLDNPPGQSYAAIERAMTSPVGGFVEQHISAFTVLARSWGMHARIAIGYDLPNGKDGTGAYQVSTADARAWPEVHFVGYGWVPFSPNFDYHDTTPVAHPAEVPRVAPPSPAPPTTDQAAAPPVSPLPAEAAQRQGLGWYGVLPGALVLVPVAGLVVLLAGGYVVFAKARLRHRRRHGPTPAATVLGAWHDQLDRLTELGISPPVSLTCHEVAAHARDRLGDAASAIEATAVLTTTATYAPEHLGEAEARQAWLLADRLRTELHPRRLSAARLRAELDPRPLWTVRSTARRRRRAQEVLEVGQYR
jgi:transglutaminase-like putative cysteine protease